MSADNEIFNNLQIKEHQKFLKPWSLNIRADKFLLCEKVFRMEIVEFNLTGFDYLISCTSFTSGDREKCAKGMTEVIDSKGSVEKTLGFYLENCKTQLCMGVKAEGLVCNLEQCFSKFNVHMNYLEIFLKCRFWLHRSRVGPELLYV